MHKINKLLATLVTLAITGQLGWFFWQEYQNPVTNHTVTRSDDFGLRLDKPKKFQPRNKLFGLATNNDAQAAEIQPKAELLPPPNLDGFKVVGVLSAGSGAQGIAILKHSSLKNGEGVFRAGESLPVQSLILHRVNPNDVVFTRSDKQLFTLQFVAANPSSKQAKATIAKTANADAPITAAPAPDNNQGDNTQTTPSTPEVKEEKQLESTQADTIRKLITQASLNPSSLTDIIRFIPLKNGTGFRLFPLKERKLFNSLGLKPGDRLLEINGKKANEITALSLPLLLNELSRSSAIRVYIERAGRYHRLNIKL